MTTKAELLSTVQRLRDALAAQARELDELTRIASLLDAPAPVDVQAPREMFYVTVPGNAVGRTLSKYAAGDPACAANLAQYMPGATTGVCYATRAEAEAAARGTAPPVGARGGVLWGFYSDGDAENVAADAFVASTGKQASVRGIYGMPPDDFWLEDAWAHGWTPWVQLWPSKSVDEVASGALDADVRAWAATFASWAARGRRAYILPMAEGNIPYNPYNGTATGYRNAFRRVRTIFEIEMEARFAPLSAAVWVFSPNGWAPPGREFEQYYPGADYVDQVCVSAYNFGGCPNPKGWSTFADAIKPHLDRLNAMTGGSKPVWLDTGTVDVGGDKDAWLRDTFAQFAATPNARGLIYYNILDKQPAQLANLPNCPGGADYRVAGWQGFKDAVSSPAYVYDAPIAGR